MSLVKTEKRNAPIPTMFEVDPRLVSEKQNKWATREHSIQQLNSNDRFKRLSMMIIIGMFLIDFYDLMRTSFLSKPFLLKRGAHYLLNQDTLQL